MHPTLFKIKMPEFLSGIFGDYFTVHSYGFYIVLGAISGVTYLTLKTRKRYGLSFETINNFFLLILIAAFVGGKVFLFFENPSYYMDHPKGLIGGKGFVFYGSLLFAIPTMLFFFRKHKLPVLEMLDVMAIVTCIVHVFGRIGCFMAGCCYGIEWHGPLSVIFKDDECLAPLNTPLHPTQLYSVSLILTILIALLIIQRKQAFKGQLFLSYLMLYAIGRSVVEIFRGDVSRGYVIDNFLSHSQFISLLVAVVAGYFYWKFYQKNRNSIQ